MFLQGRVLPVHQGLAAPPRQHSLRGGLVVAAGFAVLTSSRRVSLLQRGAMASCRLELMGLYDNAAYRRHARGLLQKAKAQGVLSGLNIPNKKPGEPLLEWAATLCQEIPSCEVTVHYSLKHQRSGTDPAEAFLRWCEEAMSVGVKRVLLVTGPRGPRQDAVWVLQRLAARQVRLDGLRLGVAFNACLPTDTERETERQRLVQKLQTGLVRDVWLNTGVDEELLGEGLTYLEALQKELGFSLQTFASAMLPSEAQLVQMRERPWNGVQFSEEFLSSLSGMGRATGKALAVFRQHKVEPIIESKVRTPDDLSKLEALLAGNHERLNSLLGEDYCQPSPSKDAKAPSMEAVSAGAKGRFTRPQQAATDDVPRSFAPPRRRWEKARGREV